MDKSINLLVGWYLSISPILFLLYCMIVSLIVRVIIMIFKTFALKDRVNELSTSYSFWGTFFRAFTGFGFSGKDVNDNHLYRDVNDNLLSFFIGAIEAGAYALFIFVNQPLLIGGWLALKTAGQWKNWAKTRTVFNRFLFGNILVILLSYFWLSHYFQNCL